MSDSGTSANTANANASAYEDLRQNLKTVISGVERVQKQLADLGKRVEALENQLKKKK